MKKSLMVVAAALFLGSIGMAYTTSSVFAEDVAAPAGVTCPHCKTLVSPGDKPVLSMLAGKTHNCSACKKDFTIAEDQNANVCSACVAEIIVCPACGSADAVPQS